MEDLSPNIREIAAGEYRHKTGKEIVGSGYVVKSLEAGLWAFASTSSYKDAVLNAVNLGGDADTTGAVVGQLAGAYYGIEGIPQGWLQKLKQRDLIEDYATRLFENRLQN